MFTEISFYPETSILRYTLKGFLFPMLEITHNLSEMWLIISASARNKAVNAFLLAVVGFFIGGTANIISAAISADLGK